MLTATQALKDKLQRSVDMNGQPRVIAEWNYNRFATVDKVSNGAQTIEQEYDNDIFPRDSIVEPERPTAGILKAFTNITYAAGPLGVAPSGFRPVTAGKDDKYKYWVSAGRSAPTTPFAIPNATPSVLYTAAVKANKIRVTFEVGHSIPSAFTIDVSVDGVAWTTVSTNPQIASNGTVELYRQTDASWTTAINRGATTPLKGVRVTVTALDRPNSPLGVIELGLRREEDLSAYVKDYSTDMELSDVSHIAPIGRVTSNEASVSLDNTAGLFTNDNPDSPYFDLLEKNVNIIIDLGVNKGTLAVPDYEWVRQFTGRTRGWSGQSRSGTTIEISDDATYLQATNPPPMLLQSVSAAESIWRLLDSVGYSSWKHDPTNVDAGLSVIPYFWADGEKNVWEVIGEIAEHFQLAVFFDEYGVLQILTRTKAYSPTTTPVWQFDSITNGLKLADIIDAEVEQDFETNEVTIEYSPTDVSEESPSGVRPMEVVWEPDDTTVLRSSQLIKTMSAADMTFTISPAEAKTWTYTGVVQVEGEFIKYDAKEYSYWNTATTVKNEFIESEEKRQELDKLSAGFNKGFTNGFTGRFRVPVGGRGVWSTTAQIHDISYTNWNSKRYRTGGTAIKNWEGGFIKNPNESVVSLKTNASFTPSSFYVCTVGSSADTNQPLYYGTRMRFHTSGYTYGAGGIVVGAGSNDSGYYIEIQRTLMTTPAYRAKYGNEIQIYYRSSAGVITRLNKGSALNIDSGVWYDIDVKLTPGVNSRQIDVLIDGVPKLSAIHAATIPADNSGARSGIWVRGNTAAQFEYFYNSGSVPESAVTDGASWWDRIKGGYQSNQYDYDYSYGAWQDIQTTGIRNKASVRSPVRSSRRFMDDFGPIVHEVREFDVKFEEGPVIYSMVYFSNETQVVCPEYNANSFGAKFVMANMSRNNAVLKGEDTLLFGSENPVDQKFLVYGRNFVKKDSRTEVVTNEGAVKRRGKVSTTISSQWIQNEDTAKALGAWIVKTWSGGSDQVSLDSFGNPLLQLGDLVSINFPSKNMAPATHQYFIVGISQNYRHGLKTRYTLRRRNFTS